MAGGVLIEHCPICQRLLGDAIDEHHLIPKTHGGGSGATIHCHVVCHQMIHAVFSEKELQKYYHTVERIISHPEIQKFIIWIANKPLNFSDPSKQMRTRKQKR